MIFKKLFEIFEEHDLFVMTLRLKILRLVGYQVMLLILTVPWKLVKTYWRRCKDIILVSFFVENGEYESKAESHFEF